MDERRVLLGLSALTIAVGVGAICWFDVVDPPLQAAPGLMVAAPVARTVAVDRAAEPVRQHVRATARSPESDAPAGSPAAMPLAVLVPTLDAAVLCGTTTWVGRVLAADGGPVAGAAVEVVQRLATARDPQVAWLELSAASTVTDEGGYYRLTQVPEQGELRLEVSLGGRRVAHRSLDEVDALHLLVSKLDGRAEVRVASNPTLPAPAPGAPLRGRLLDENGDARDGWWVALVAASADQRFAGSRYFCAPQRCSARGEFVFDAVPHGDWRVEAWHPRNAAVARGELSHRDDGVEAGGGAIEVVAAAASLPPRLVGRLCDDTGAPVGGARVGLVRPTGYAVAGRLGMLPAAVASTDANGRFAIDTRGASALALSVDALGVEPLHVALEVASAPGTPLQVVVARRLCLRAAAPLEPRFVGDGELVAIDADGHQVPLYGGDLSPAVLQAPVDVTTVALPRAACALLWRRDGREFGRLQLRGRDEPPAWRVAAPQLLGAAAPAPAGEPGGFAPLR